MELRQVVTTREKEIFLKKLSEGRAFSRAEFRDRNGAKITESHVEFGDTYALLEDGRPLDEIQAGFCLHALSVLPPSGPVPSLPGLSPDQIVEGGELFSLKPGAGRLAFALAGAVAGAMQARALMLYAICNPVDMRKFVAPSGFVPAGETFVWPYAETMAGEDVNVQLMLLHGLKLANFVKAGFELVFRPSEEGRILRLAAPESATFLSLDAH